MILKCQCDYCGLEGATITHPTKTQGLKHYHRECLMLIEPKSRPYMCSIEEGDAVMYRNLMSSQVWGTVVSIFQVNSRRLYVIMSRFGDFSIKRRSEFIKPGQDSYGP